MPKKSSTLNDPGTDFFWDVIPPKLNKAKPGME